MDNEVSLEAITVEFSVDRAPRIPGTMPLVQMVCPKSLCLTRKEFLLNGVNLEYSILLDRNKRLTSLLDNR